MSYSGLFDGHYGTPHSLIDGDNANQKITRLVGRRRANRVTKELLNTLIGAAAGSAAADSYTRLSAPAGLIESEQLGGLRAIETVTTIDRNSTAADVTALKATINDQFKPDTYVADASGNGGGGKLEQGL